MGWSAADFLKSNAFFERAVAQASQYNARDTQEFAGVLQSWGRTIYESCLDNESAGYQTKLKLNNSLAVFAEAKAIYKSIRATDTLAYGTCSRLTGVVLRKL